MYCKSEKLPLDKLSSALCRVCPLKLGGSKEKLLSVLALALLLFWNDLKGALFSTAVDAAPAACWAQHFRVGCG